MSDENTGSAGEPNAALGRLLGWQKAQQAVDTMVKSLSDFTKALDGAKVNVKNDSKATRAGAVFSDVWNGTKNSTLSGGRSNGGGSIFGGMAGYNNPINQQYQQNAPNIGSGAASAWKGKPLGGGVSFGGSGSGSSGSASNDGGGGYWSSFGAGGLSETVGAVTQMGKRKAYMYSAQTDMYQAAQSAPGRNWSQLYRSTIGVTGKTNQTMWGAQDATAGAFNFSRMGGFGQAGGGSSLLANINSTGLVDPSISNTQANSAASQAWSASTANSLRSMGITSVGVGGSLKSPRDIANQILQKIPGQSQIKTTQQLTDALDNPAGGIAQTLNNWQANGLLPGDLYQSVKEEIRGILLARVNANMSYSQYNATATAAQGGSKSARNVLKSAGISGSLDQTTRSYNNQLDSRDADHVVAFTKGVEGATAALGALREAASKALQNPAGSALYAAAGATSAVGHSPSHAGRNLGAAWATAAVASRVVSKMAPAGSKFASLFSSSAGTAAGVAGDFKLGLGGMLGSIGFGFQRDTLTYQDEGLTEAEERRRLKSMGATPKVINEKIAKDNAISGTGKGGASGSDKQGGTPNQSKGRAVRLSAPVSGPITSGFGPRKSPGGVGSTNHKGIDFGVNVGTPVKSAATGVVQDSASGGGFGNYILIDHGGGMVTRYAHLSRSVVKKGQSVSGGTLIAYSGNTGNTTGPHLHFEVILNGSPVDPAPYVTGVGAVSQTSAISGAANTTAAIVGAGAATSAGNYGSVNETDALSSLLAGSVGTAPGASGSSSSGGSSGIGASSSTGSGVANAATAAAGTSVNATGIQGIAQKLAAARGWVGQEWNDLNSLVKSESSWNPTAQNKTSTAYGLFQFLNDTWKPYGAKTSDPTTQIQYGLSYVADRYKDPTKAWSFHKSHGYYDKGAWDIPDDADARVHKGEMIIPKGQAETIRNALLKEVNPSKGGGSGGVNVTIGAGAIVVNVSGAMSQSAAKAAGVQMANSLSDRIKQIQGS